MTRHQYLILIQEARKPAGRDLIDLKESNRTQDLLDFLTYHHPSVEISANGSKGRAEAKLTHRYTIYETGILERSEYQTKFYPFKN